MRTREEQAKWDKVLKYSRQWVSGTVMALTFALMAAGGLS